MAKPKRQHFLPQFLLRGFAIIKHGQHYVYRFPRTGQPHLANIINVAVAGKFHEGQYGDIEAQLSTREGLYSQALDELRQGRRSEATIGLIAELVFNIMVRTKNIRDGVTEFATTAIRGFQTPRIERAMRKYVLKRLLEKPEIKRSLQSVPKERRERVLSMWATKSGSDFGILYKRILEGIQQKLDIAEVAKNSQLQLLSRCEVPEPRKESLLNYEWQIDQRPSDTYVIGDVGPVARVPDSSQLTFPYGFGIPAAVYLPISSSELLVGASHADAEQINPDEVNLASIRLSRDFFVSSQNTEKEMDYRKYIGTGAELIKEADALRMLDEVLEEITARQR